MNYVRAPETASLEEKARVAREWLEATGKSAFGPFFKYEPELNHLPREKADFHPDRGHAS